MVNDLTALLGIIKKHIVAFKMPDSKYMDDMNKELFDVAELRELLDTVKNYNDLGSLYLSFWREVTHFEGDDPFYSENSRVFVAILEALKRAVENEINQS